MKIVPEGGEMFYEEPSVGSCPHILVIISRTRKERREKILELGSRTIDCLGLKCRYSKCARKQTQASRKSTR